MKIIAVTVGKKHKKHFADAIETYEKRLKTYCDFSWHFVSSSDTDGESAAILKLFSPDDVVVLLDEKGVLPTNEELADTLERIQNESTKRLFIIIGGAYGVNYELMQRANKTFSISKLVFPHQLVRLILVEQLYRSYSMLAGAKYHHD